MPSVLWEHKKIKKATHTGNRCVFFVLFFFQEIQPHVNLALNQKVLCFINHEVLLRIGELFVTEENNLIAIMVGTIAKIY